MSVVDGLATANFTDPHNQRIIYLAVGGLLLLAVIVAVGTVLWWRSTKAEHPALAPLEVMSTRKFEKSDYTDRKRVLDEVRPVGSVADPHDDAVSDVVDLQAASEAPLPDPAELADPEHPIPSEGAEPERAAATLVASADDATVAAELPAVEADAVVPEPAEPELAEPAEPEEPVAVVASVDTADGVVAAAEPGLPVISAE